MIPPAKRAAAVTVAAIALMAAGLFLRLQSARQAHEPDKNFHWQLSRSIVQSGEMAGGEAYVVKDFLRKPPLLPGLLSLWKNPDAYLTTQAVISVATAVPIFFLGYFGGGALVGLVTLALWCFWGPAIVLCGGIYQEPLFGLLFAAGLVAGMLALEKRHVGLIAASGLSLSLAELTRPVLLPFALLVVGLLAVQAVRDRQARKRLAAMTLVFAAGYFLPVGVYHAARSEHGLTWVYDRKGVTLITATIPDGRAFDFLREHKPENWSDMTDAERDHSSSGCSSSA
ncbi:MAG: hypothetical protein M5R36_12065 [Deltaproteobacteria bacterium]|nr:hypothetical protein [Deltaproteobacteria bacterium]